MKKIYLCFLLLSVSYLQIFAQEVPEKQKIVVTKISATWCPICGGSAWDNFKSLIEKHPNDATYMVAHISSSSKLYSPTAKEYASNLPEVFGQPLFYANKEKYSTGSLISSVESKMAEVQNQPPIAGAGITATFDNNNLHVKAKVKFFQATEGDYYLSLFVVENGVIEDQASRGNNVSHAKVLRTAVTSNTFGEAIASGSINSGKEINTNASIPLDASWNTDKLEVAAILWKAEGNNGFTYINSHSVGTSFATSVNILEEMGVELAVSPSIIHESAVVQLKLPNALKAINLSIFDISGRKVHTIFEGDLTAGQHSFLLDKAALSNNGLYFLRMEKDGQSISQKIVIR